MDALTLNHFKNLFIKDPQVRYESFQWLSKATAQPVDWAYEAWNDLLKLSESGYNHQRTIAVQLLSSLAKSDPEERILKDLPLLMAVTWDEKFVTARHSLQSLWKIGIVNKKIRDELLFALSRRFDEASTEKNCTLVRYDIIVVLRKIFNESKDEKVKETALRLMQSEEDQKYRKKYMGEWKDLLKEKI